MVKTILKNSQLKTKTYPNLDKTATNQEILSIFREQAMSGQMFTFHVSEPRQSKGSKDTYHSIHVAIAHKSVESVADQLTGRMKVTRYIFGYVIPQTCVALFKPLLKPGGLLESHDFKIQTVYSDVPFYANQAPFTTKNGSVLHCEDRPIYESSVIVSSNEPSVISNSNNVDLNNLELVEPDSVDEFFVPSNEDNKQKQFEPSLVSS